MLISNLQSCQDLLTERDLLENVTRMVDFAVFAIA
jgi:hypothetical protein